MGEWHDCLVLWMLWKLKDWDFFYPESLVTHSVWKGKSTFPIFLAAKQGTNRGRFTKRFSPCLWQVHFGISFYRYLQYSFSYHARGIKGVTCLARCVWHPWKAGTSVSLPVAVGWSIQKGNPQLCFFKCSVWKTCTEKWARCMWPRQIPRSFLFPWNFDHSCLNTLYRRYSSPSNFPRSPP